MFETNCYQQRRLIKVKGNLRVKMKFVTLTILNAQKYDLAEVFNFIWFNMNNISNQNDPDISNHVASMIKFQERLIYFKIFNCLVILWASIEIVFFITVISVSKCRQMIEMLVGFLLSEVVLLLCPIFCLVFSTLRKYFTFGYFWFGFTVLCKIAVILVICLVGWRHVGKCYLGYNMKYVLIGVNIGQILLIGIFFILLRRVKKVYRDIKIQNIVNSKNFDYD